ncbi:MAG TPA: ATP-binding cassette domain-containing protein, partial [Acidimicrobiia bacterium]
VTEGERWVIVGPNGAGKTTLLRVASLHQHPSSGRVRVLGEELGHCDVRTVRARIGISSPTIAARLEPSMNALEVVMTARYGALAPWWHTYDEADRARAGALLARFGIADLADHGFTTLSAGETQRALLARALMREPELLLLDEPTAGLDIGAREQVLGDLAALLADAGAPPMVIVTHHLEEIPAGCTHALALTHGRVVAQGPILDILTSDTLSACYGLPLEVTHDRARFTARLA